MLVILANLSFMENFFSLLSIFEESNRYGGYVENASAWFATSGSERKSTVFYLAAMLPFYIVLYYLHKIKDFVPHAFFIYNILIINILFRSISSGSEIVMRISNIYDFSFLLATSVVLFNWRKYRNQMLLLVVLATFVYKTYIFIKPYKSDLLMMYVWDSNKIEDVGKASLLYDDER